MGKKEKKEKEIIFFFNEISFDFNGDKILDYLKIGTIFLILNFSCLDFIQRPRSWHLEPNGSLEILFIFFF